MLRVNKITQKYFLAGSLYATTEDITCQKLLSDIPHSRIPAKQLTLFVVNASRRVPCMNEGEIDGFFKVRQSDSIQNLL